MSRRQHTTRSLLEALESRELLCAAPQLTVMSQNLYMGANLAPVLGLLAQGDAADVPAAVTGVWAAQQATDFNVRAPVIARRIAKARPDIVGLQEVQQWVFIPPTGDAQVTDFLTILTTDLAKRGMHYTPVVVTADYAAILPDDKGDYVSLTDRNVILVNQDAKGLKVTSSADGHYAAQLVIGNFNENTSWQSVDVTKGGRMARYVNTHLTSFNAQLQQAQAGELLTGPLATNIPVILGGDFNADAYNGAYGGPDVTGTYAQLTGAGLKDAWTAAHPGKHAPLGLTWGPDDTLTSPVPTLNERIDFFFLQGTLQVREMHLKGAHARNMPGGLTWATDHAGIVATIELSAAPVPTSHEVLEDALLG